MATSSIPPGPPPGAILSAGEGGTEADGTRSDRTAPGAARAGGAEYGGTASAVPDSGGPPSAADLLRVALLVSRARAAARAGDLDGALRTLRDADTMGTVTVTVTGPRTRTGADDRRGHDETDPDAPVVAGHPDALDLLARVHAQRGEPERAAACWRRALELNPEDPAASAGLARIDRLAGRGPRAALARHRTATALAAAVCALAAVTAGTAVLADGAGGRPERSGPSQADLVEQRARQLAAARRAEQARDRDRAATRRAEAAEALARALRAPGIRPQAHGASVEIAFADGLFSEGAVLTPSGAGRLAVLGERLAGRRLHVEIHGHAATVPGAPTGGGSVVSLWRALIAARELSDATGMPLTAFTTVSADQRDAPYAEPVKNRTVTVVITPAWPTAPEKAGPASSPEEAGPAG
ncbi:tetratricopeptide repeat protein [Streptomyces mutabilis]|uniref:tetratricopeptide repeat protein n=1 Tax=Streptomyces mutabilis TaxID=67332 RepID=UPI0006946E32|nr:tetratricopeptide repeat protein [Streptomyces mutabilis]